MKKYLLLLFCFFLKMNMFGQENSTEESSTLPVTQTLPGAMIVAPIEPPPGDGGGSGYTWFRDGDSDGYGRPDFQRVSTIQPVGFVANDDDCNDGDRSVYPGAREVADGKDNDCDGFIDEGLAPSMPPIVTVTLNCGYTTLTRTSPPSGVTYYWQTTSSGTSTLNSSLNLNVYSGNVYYLRARNNSSLLWSSSRTVSYTLSKCSVKPAVPESFENDLGNWQPTGTASHDWRRYSGSTPSSNTGPSDAKAGIYYMYMEASSNPNKTSVLTSPMYTIPAGSRINFSYHMRGSGQGTLKMEVSRDGVQWKTLWTKSGDQGNFWKIAEVDLSLYGGGTVQLRFHGTIGSTYLSDIAVDDINFVTGSGGIPQFSDENYIFTRVYKDNFTSSLMDPSVDDAIEEITYFDGFGRPMQHIGIRQAGGNKFEDIVTHIGYDNYGRKGKEYLPYPDNGMTPGMYKSGNNLLNAQNYYKTNYAADFAGISTAAGTNPYSETTFEASPLNRIIEKGAPGKDWRVVEGSDTDHTIKITYSTNSLQEVRLYKVKFGSDKNPELLLSGYYSVGQLYKTITKNENWTTGQTYATANTIEEFKDKQGRIILKRTYGPSDENMNGVIEGGESNLIHDTYYVYNDYGNLTFVLPPKWKPSSASPDDKAFQELCYQYRYDGENKLIEKRIPGKGWEYTVYNKLDQPVMTQHANQQKINSGKSKEEWLFTKYDAFGRVAYTGLYKATTTNRETLQNSANSSTYSSQYVTRGTLVNIAGTPVYYDNSAIPTGISDVYSVNYYDSYLPDGAVGKVIIPEINSLGVSISTLTNGFATVNRVRVLGTSEWITTTIAYDKDGREVWVRTVNDFLDTDDLVEHRYDFSGNIEETKSLHSRNGLSTTVRDYFEYDHVNRLKVHRQSVNGGSLEVIAENNYDKLGKLIQKGVGNSGSSRLQDITYAYNIRGWLKSINNISSAAKLFNLTLYYNDGSGIDLFNGNISQAKWRTINKDNSIKTYTYGYDALNRINDAKMDVSNYDLTGVSYDKNGNITSLRRNGWKNSSSYIDMDKLVYTYENTSNKLTKVLDNGNDDYGFKDIGNTGTLIEYTYDTNGNMLKDFNKGITDITYNHLDLPERILIGGQEIRYFYDATGVKQKKVAAATTTDYAGNYLYKNGTFQFFHHPEGYAYLEKGSFKYVYNYKDHLENIRLSYTNTGTVNSPVAGVVEENNYYPFGLNHGGSGGGSPRGNGAGNMFKFGGKELQDEQVGGKNLDWYDFGARNYNPALGRWMNVDLLADKDDQIDKSPYAFAWNNPTNLIDPDGRAVFSPIFNSNGRFLGTDNQGVGGNAIIMNEMDFQQGMSHKEALEKGSLYSDLPVGHKARIMAESFMEEASSRPDTDGAVTFNEVNSWARRGSFYAEKKYGNGNLFVDVRKIDISKFSFEDIKRANGKGNFYFNFLNLSAATKSTLGYFFLRSDNSDTGMIYGNIRMAANKNGTIDIGNRNTRLIDLYDFNTQDGSYYKRGANALGQHISTVGGKYRINNYYIYGYGTKRINY